MNKMRVRSLVFTVTVILTLFLAITTVSAATTENTTMTVGILNTAPNVDNITMRNYTVEPGDILYVNATITDVNGVPVDIFLVNGSVDMGSAGSPGDDEFFIFSYAIKINDSTGVYTQYTYSLPTNAPFGTYTLYVNASDGSLSDMDSIQFSVVDATIPIINNVSDNGPITPSDSLNLTANVTDNVAVNLSEVKVNISGVFYPMTYTGTGDIFYFDGWDTNVTAGQYCYTVYANDTYGNAAIPVQGCFDVQELVSLSLAQYPIEFGNTTIPISQRRADNGTGSTIGMGYDGDSVVEGFPLVVTNNGNVDENFTISGTNLYGLTDNNFNISVTDVAWNTAEVVGGATALSSSDQDLDWNVAMLGTTDVYFWINIPAGKPAQQYRGNVTISAEKS